MFEIRPGTMDYGRLLPLICIFGVSLNVFVARVDCSPSQAVLEDMYPDDFDVDSALFVDPKIASGEVKNLTTTVETKKNSTALTTTTTSSPSTHIRAKRQCGFGGCGNGYGYGGGCGVNGCGGGGGGGGCGPNGCSEARGYNCGPGGCGYAPGCSGYSCRCPNGVCGAMCCQNRYPRPCVGCGLATGQTTCCPCCRPACTRSCVNNGGCYCDYDYYGGFGGGGWGKKKRSIPAIESESVSPSSS